MRTDRTSTYSPWITIVHRVAVVHVLGWIGAVAIGDRIDKLPSDSRAVVIQGEKLYNTPSGLYYKEVTEGNRVYYELVGK